MYISPIKESYTVIFHRTYPGNVQLDGNKQYIRQRRQLRLTAVLFLGNLKFTSRRRWAPPILPSPFSLSLSSTLSESESDPSSSCCTVETAHECHCRRGPQTSEKQPKSWPGSDRRESLGDYPGRSRFAPLFSTLVPSETVSSTRVAREWRNVRIPDDTERNIQVIWQFCDRYVFSSNRR